MPMLDGSAVLYEAADPLVRYSPVINCHPIKNVRSCFVILLCSSFSQAQNNMTSREISLATKNNGSLTDPNGRNLTWVVNRQILPDSIFPSFRICLDFIHSIFTKQCYPSLPSTCSCSQSYDGARAQNWSAVHCQLVPHVKPSVFFVGPWS